MDNTTIIHFLTAYQYPAIFIGSFFFGESVIITAAFLAGQGIWSVQAVFWLALIGTIVSDSIWFLFGQSIIRSLKYWQRMLSKYEQYLQKIERLTGNKPFLALLFIKFLYGTRILTILYMSVRKMSYGRFLLFNTIGTIFWLVTMVAIGWLAGKGITNFIPVVARVEYLLLAVALLIIMYKAVSTWMEKRFIKK